MVVDYLFIRRFSLFVDEEKVTANVKSHLNVDRKNGETMFVQMYPYQSVGDYLAKYATAVDGKVWLSGESTNFALFSIVEKVYDNILDCTYLSV